MNAIRFAVIGAGHLGRIHARLLDSIDEVQLIGIADPSHAARRAAAAECGAATFPDPRPLLGHIDAAVVATPTHCHHAVAMELLRQGVHVLIEKPLASNMEQADELIRTARSQRRVLQVGHVERFNPALQAARPYLRRPRYIEAIRTGPFTCRSTDVGVVLDLMIHDLDVILSLVPSRLSTVQALGISILGGHEDMAQARLEFENGCVANLSASRTSFEAHRRMQVFGDDGFAAVDFAKRSVRVIRPHEQLLRRGLSVEQLSTDEKTDLRENLFRTWLPLEELTVREANPLRDELTEFVRCIRTGQAPQVDGMQAREALDVALQVVDRIDRHRWDGTDSGLVGPRAVPLPRILPGPTWGQSPEGTPRRKAG